MRTTLDLPDDLLKRAKIVAVERGATLRELVTDGLRRALAEERPSARRRMTKAPIRLSADSPLRALSLEDIKAAEAATEAESVRAIYRRP